MGELLIRSTAMLAVACYAGRMVIDVAGPRDDRCQRRARWIWTIGSAAMVAHGICAFHFQHGWSHAAAWEHTRQRTFDLTGWNTGVGLYANYAMTVMWLVDLIGWRTSLEWPRRQRIWYGIVQSVFAFLMLNATAVFGPGYWRAIVVGYITALSIVRYNASAKRR